MVRLFMIVGCYFAIASLVGFIQTFLQHFIYPRMTYLRIRYIADAFNKVIRADYPYMEDSDFMADTSRTLQAVSANHTGVEEVYHQLFLAPAELFTTIGFIFLIGYLNVWMIIGLFLHLAVTLVINYRVHRYEYSKRKDISKTRRKIDYYHRTTHDFSYGKDLRIYGLRDRLIQNYRYQIQTLTAIHREIKRKAYAFSFISLLTLLISDGIIYGLLIRETVNGLSIANFSMYLASTISLSSLLLSFTHRLSRIYSQGQYVYEFFTYMERDLGEKGGPIETVSDDTLMIEFRNVSFKYPKTDRYIIFGYMTCKTC